MNDDSEILRRLAFLVESLQRSEDVRMAMEKGDANLQARTVAAVATILFIIGSIVVLLLTGRPTLLVLVALICYVGWGISFIGSCPSNPKSKGF